MAFQNTSEDFSEKESGLAMLVRGGGIVIAVLLFMGWLYVAFQVGAASASDYNQNGE